MTDYNFVVSGIVPALQQPTDSTCWATSTTMLMSWRDNVSYSIETAMSMIGDKWLQKFKNNEGLDETMGSDEESSFLADSKLRAEPPASYTLDALVQMMQSSGPLMVTTATSDPAWTHARVLFGISGDGTLENTFLQINDPADGQTHQESLADFLPKYEGVVDPDYAVSVQILHW
jgi:hypothetical protein